MASVPLLGDAHTVLVSTLLHVEYGKRATAFYDSYFRDSPESQRHIYDDQDAPTAVVAAPSGPANAAGLIDRAKA